MESSKLPLHIRLLQHELDERKRRNPRYSMRALARLLDIDPSALSRALTGKQDLSLETCRTILQKLNLPIAQARLFIASVSEDKRSHASTILTRALEPKYLSDKDEDPRLSHILGASAQVPLAPRDIYAFERDLVSVMDTEGRFLFANETIAKNLGVLPCELIGERWPPTTFDVQTPPLLEKQQLEVVNAKKEMTFEFNVGRNENARTLRRTISPIFGANGEMSAYISSIRDVTWDRFLYRASLEVHSTIETPKLLELAARLPTPLLADGCAIHIDNKRHGVMAAHRLTDGKPYADIIRPVIEGVNAEEPAITKLSGDLSRRLTYADRAPTHSLITPFKIDGKTNGVVLFVGSRTYNDFDLQIATDYTQSVASALRNAMQFEKIS